MPDLLGYMILIIEANMEYDGKHGLAMIAAFDKEQLLTKRLSGHNQAQRYGTWLSQARQKLTGVVTASA